MADQDLIFRIKADAQQAMAELRAASGSLLGLKDATGQVLTPMQALIAKTVEMAGASNNAKESAAAFTSGLATEREAFDRLRASVDPLFAAQLRYTTATNEARIAEQLGIASKEETATVLQQLTARYEAETTAASRSGAAVTALGRSHSASGFMVQNAAYQFGDFAVQVASGTSPIRAASQQIPQLLGAFGMWGAIFGAAAAVILPLIGNLFKAGDAEESFSTKTDRLKNSVDAAKNALAAAGTPIADLRKEYGDLADTMQDVLQKQAQIAVNDANNAVRKSGSTQFTGVMGADTIAELEKNQQVLRGYMAEIDAYKQKALASGAGEVEAVTEAMAKMSEMHPGVDFDAMTSKATDFKLHLDQISHTYQITTDQAERLAAANAKWDSAISLADKVSAGQELLNVMTSVWGTIGAANDATGGFAKLLDQAVQSSIELKTATDKAPASLDAATKSAVGLETAMGGVEQAANATVARLIGVAAAAAAAQSAAQGQAAAPHGIGPAGQVDASTAYVSQLAKQAADAAHYLAWKPPSITPLSTGGGGSGGGASAPSIPTVIAQAGTAMQQLSSMGQSLSSALSSDFSNAFSSFVSGAQSGKSAFSSLASSIISDIAKIASQKFTDSFITPLLNTLMGGLSFGATPAATSIGGTTALSLHANGNIFAGGNVVPFATGGIPGLSTYRNAIVSGPTFFAMGGTGVMGEAGPEAIMPLSRGPGGVLGVKGSGSNVVVNITTPPGSSVKQSQSMQGSTRILDFTIEAAKSAVIDDIAHGGPISDALNRSFGAKRQGT
jgi:hypothetical protein